MLPHRAIRELSVVVVIAATIWIGLPAAVISGSSEPIDTARVFLTLCVTAIFILRAIWRRKIEPRTTITARAHLPEVRRRGTLHT